MHRAAATVIVLATVALAGCDGGSVTGPSPPRAGSEISSSPTIGSPSTVAADLDVPWGIGFLPDGSALVNERDTGRVLHLTSGGTLTTAATLDVRHGGEAGLLGLAVSPSYADDHLVYVYYSTHSDNRVVRFTYDGSRAGAAQPVLTDIPVGTIHDGGRIAFGPDGKLYIGTGETGDGALAQDRGSLAGKILRINPDGSVPSDNPFGSPVWTYGHRNVEGLAWDAQGRMFATEFGPNRDDEINLIVKGRDYGWPVVTGKRGGDRFTDPLVTFAPDEFSASGAAIAGGALWTAALNGERLYRIPLQADGTLGTPQAMLDGRYGRLRTVVLAPDGALWVTTSNRDGRGDPAAHDDRILSFPLK